MIVLMNSVLMIYILLYIFKTFLHKGFLCTMQGCSIKLEFCTAIGSSSISFTSPSLLPAITEAASETTPDMLTMEK